MKKFVTLLCMAVMVVLSDTELSAADGWPLTSFEGSEGFVPGQMIDATDGWSVRFGTATVSDLHAKLGGRSLRLHGGSDPAVEVLRTFGFQGEPPSICYIDFWIRPVVEVGEGALSAVEVNGSVIAFCRSASSGSLGTIRALDGVDTLPGALEEWPQLAWQFRLAPDGRSASEWIRITIRQDFRLMNEGWDLYVNEKMIAANLGFSGRHAQPTEWLAFGSTAAADVYIDQVQVTRSNPVAVDINDDGIIDSWATANLPVGSQASAATAEGFRNSLRADGRSQIAAYVDSERDGLFLSADGSLADSDSDDIPDYWEDQWGLRKFLAADAQMDPDFDGLTSLEEFQRGTNPLSAPLYHFMPVELPAGDWNGVNLVKVSPGGTMLISGYSVQHGQRFMVSRPGEAPEIIMLPAGFQAVTWYGGQVADNGAAAGFAYSAQGGTAIWHRQAGQAATVIWSGAWGAVLGGMSSSGRVAGFLPVGTSQSDRTPFTYDPMLPANQRLRVLSATAAVFRAFTHLPMLISGDRSVMFAASLQAGAPAQVWRWTPAAAEGEADLLQPITAPAGTGYTATVAGPDGWLSGSSETTGWRIGEGAALVQLYRPASARGMQFRGVSSLGNAVGEVYGSDGYSTRAAWWPSTTTGALLLPSLRASDPATALGMSVRNEIVGTSGNVPVLWRDGRVHSLQECMGGSGTAELSGVDGISEAV